jgi:hypothetical protein
MVRRWSLTGHFLILYYPTEIPNFRTSLSQVLYDPTMSERGALNCMARAPRCMDPVDVNIKPVIYNPHALPMYREDFMNMKRKQRDDGKDMKDPKVTKRPEQPLSGPGVGGRLGTTGGTLLTQYLMKEKGMIKVRALPPSLCPSAMLAAWVEDVFFAASRHSTHSSPPA